MTPYLKFVSSFLKKLETDLDSQLLLQAVCNYIDFGSGKELIKLVGEDRAEYLQLLYASNSKIFREIESGVEAGIVLLAIENKFCEQPLCA